MYDGWKILVSCRNENEYYANYLSSMSNHGMGR